ncbi:hypothetical protein BX666DRAFT_1849525 [Dichotomocladium elegans]|nr:hypothetical protein BX666DRAFT_1849525 [Dichotomocladium elegans]
MFVPTIKYRRVNDTQDYDQAIEKQQEKSEESTRQDYTEQAKVPEKEGKEPVKEDGKAEGTGANIAIDPSNEDRIIVTLSNGKKYTADRYCPHAGADLSYLGEVAEDEYPAEIGPILLCTLHYWEFALEKGGRSGGGWASLNACPAGECPVKDTKLEW